ncbi:Tm-1-like ATP-binding domain-containing protein [Actinotalea sp.]|uniref:Tm-1-like ATP-binding domain-containing protein n=1 Tax=Actinotalea sp. TaxID=1872145 RepID=UPI0035681ED4
MSRKPVVCLAGTLDTKGVEYAYVKECIERQGVDVLTVDCGVMGEPSFTPDVPSSVVAARAGVELAEFAERKEGADGRTRAVLKMGAGLGVVLQELLAEGRIDAVLGMGGTGGTDLLSPAFRGLPIGFPKLIVSTVGSGNTKPYVGSTDLTLMNAVTDIAGLNRISLLVLANAAHAAAGMAKGHEFAQSQAGASKPLIAITMWGVTTPGVMRMREHLERDGFEVIIFHAVGEGAGMEALIDGGVIDGLIDFSLPEILNHWNKGIFDPEIDRMEAAIRTGIPLVVVPGALEAFNFGAIASIPVEYATPERYVIEHNPNISSLRANKDEMHRLGEYVADHVNRAPGPKAVAIPWKATSNYGGAGSQWEGLDLHPMLDPLVGGLDKDIEVLQMDANINDPAFADAVYGLFKARWEQSLAAKE